MAKYEDAPKFLVDHLDSEVKGAARRKAVAFIRRMRKLPGYRLSHGASEDPPTVKALDKR